MSGLDELVHTFESISTGGEIIVLDTGAQITPEAEAMLQALHSRSIGGFRSHMSELAKRGSDKFMGTFYVGYGHQSIGDCGTTTVFIEGVSMLAAKAVQDWALYSGQEASTRYIDFESQHFYDPLELWGESVLEKWREFYSHARPILVEHMKTMRPLGEDEKESVWEKAINAQAFDVLRGFLPAGATTNLAWHTNLRQAADKLMYLRHHPLQEVRAIAKALQRALQKAHPNSFGQKRHEDTEAYNQDYMQNYYLFHPAEYPNDLVVNFDGLLLDHFMGLQSLLSKRPAKTLLPDALKHTGSISAKFLLDFGSFRDLQRHRALNIRMPMLSEDFGFEPWYLQQLPEGLREHAESLLETQSRATEGLPIPDASLRQYYVPMGYRCPMMVTGTLPAWVYTIELRATRFVHPTLRNVMQEIAERFDGQLGKRGLKLHLDLEPDQFDVRRGEHDITFKA